MNSLKWPDGGFVVALCLLGVLGAAALYDLAAAYSNPPSAPVSRYLRDWSTAYPLIPFAAGVLVGHLLWP